MAQSLPEAQENSLATGSLTRSQLALLRLLENALWDPVEETLHQALAYAERGWPVLPCCWPNQTGGCGCGRGHKGQAVGKAPLAPKGVHDATTDPEAIGQWWARWPLANIGVALEPEHLLVLDLDGPSGVDEALAHGLPPGPVASTGREAGQHRFFLNPWPGMASATKRGESKSIDVKTTGYVIAPPSSHRSGRKYCWLLDPDETPVQPAPDWVRRCLQPVVAVREVQLSGVLPNVNPAHLRVPQKIRNLIRLANPQGYPSRSEAGFAVIVAMLRAGYSDQEIAGVILSNPIGNYVHDRDGRDPLRWIAGEIARARAKESPKRSRKWEPGVTTPPTGLAASEGAGAPDTLAGAASRGDDMSLASASLPQPTEGEGQEPPHLTDSGNAQRLARLHGKDLRYCHEWGKWLTWDGQRWAIDNTGEVMRRAKDTVRRIYAEAAGQNDSHQRQAIAGHAKQSESESRLRAMTTLAQSEPGIPIRPQDLDNDLWKLNVQNGTLDLSSGEPLLHSRDDLITKLAPVVYDVDAQCPRWHAFLDRIFGGDADLLSFVRRAVGYTLTGSAKEEVFFLLYGTGANGKSTFLEVLRAILGEYARTADFDTFLRKERSGVPNDIARLAGARLVTAQETEGGARLAEVVVKQMTGNDTMLARYLYSEYFEFRPAFKLFLAANHKPLVRGTDLGIWRRTRLVPFAVTIPEQEQDKDLLEKLKQELPGILAWAVRGCLEWHRDGLGVATAVTEATGEFREESDILGTFLAECCVLGDAEKVAASGIYASYKDWAVRTGEQPVSQTAFGRQLGERGFVRRKSSGRNLWQGIGVAVGDGRDGLDGFSGKSYVREDKGEVARKPSNHPWTVPSDDANASPARDG